MSVTQPDFSVTLKRDIGLHKAAQTLADATRCRSGLEPLPLSQLNSHDRVWFRQTARNLIEIFETLTNPERERDAERERRERTEQRGEWEAANATAAAAGRRRSALASAFATARSRALDAASGRGHELGAWRADESEDFADCRRCGRRVALMFNGDDIVARGAALSEGCLAAAPEPVA